MMVEFHLLVGERFMQHPERRHPGMTEAVFGDGVGGQSAAWGLAFPSTVCWGTPVQKAGLAFGACLGFTAISGALQTSRRWVSVAPRRPLPGFSLALFCDDKPSSCHAIFHEGASGDDTNERRIMAQGHKTYGFSPAF